MIDWVHELCRDWGSYMRRSPKKWPSKNTVWRLWKEQGASGAEPGPANPDWDIDEDVLELHRVWRSMPEELSDLLFVFYVKRCEPKRKAEMLGVSITKMYELRSHAHYYIVGRLAQKDSGISTTQAAG